MTSEQYNTLTRFEIPCETNFETLKTKLQLAPETMFQIYTLHNRLIFAKITETFENTLFDIKETDSAGTPVPRPLYANCLTKTQIAERIYQGDWRVV